MQENQPGPRYQSPARLVRILKPLLIAYAVGGVLLLAVIALMGPSLASLSLNTGRGALLRILGPMAVVTLLTILVGGIQYATIVFQYLWIYRLRENLIAFNIFGLRFSPGWSIGWFLVPVMNIVRPWQIMKETVQASQIIPAGADPQAWKKPGAPRLCTGGGGRR